MDELFYKALLKKYMEHIIKQEGVAFLNGYESGFSEDEMAALRAIWDLTDA